MKKYLLFFTVLILTVLGALWINLSPSISPKDVELKGVLKRIEDPPEPKLDTTGLNCDYVVEVQLNKRTSKPLNTENDYIHDIYTYVDGISLGRWDYLHRMKWNGNHGTVLGREGFSLGENGFTSSRAAKRLKELGIISGKSDVEITNNFNLASSGFSYIGDRFPAKIRYYLITDNGVTPNLERSFLIYSHYEVKWGKDLSWTKLVPVEFNFKSI